MEQKQHLEQKGYTGQQKLTIFVVVLTAFVTTFTGSALNLSIPDIGQQFGVSAQLVGWLITGYTLAVAAISVPMGRLADITCRKTVLVAGTAVFTVCCIAAVFSISLMMLLILRIVQGIGAAMIFSTNTAVLLSAFPGTMRGRVIGYSIAATYGGLSAGPVIGGILNQNLGWQSIFVLTGFLSLVSLAAAVWKLPKERAENSGHSMDLPGNLLYVIFIVLLMYGLSEIGTRPLPLVLAAIGLTFGAVFVWRELKADEPAVNLSMFRKNIGYACSNLSALLNYGATFAVSYLISIYLQVVMGYSSQTAGMIMIAQPLIMAVLSPVTGRFSDKISPFKMSSVGMALCAAGAALFVFLHTDTSLVLILTALVITGMGFSLFSSPNTNAVMSCVEQADYGVASSILATMRSIGNTLSMVIVTIVVNRFLRGVPLADAQPEVLVQVIRISFIVFTAICIAGIFLSLKRK